MAPIPTLDTQTAYLADQLERTFRGGAWHGPAVAQALAGVDAAAAARRPVAGAHSIWEIAEHLRFWMEVAARRLRGEAPGPGEEEEDWAPPLRPSEEAWKGTVAAVERAHRNLREVVLALDDGRLDDPVAGSDPTVRGLLFGVLQHNAYHAGQIALLRKAQTPREAGS